MSNGKSIERRRAQSIGKVVLSSGLGGCLALGTALAQTPPAPNDEGPKLETVTVTADRKERDLQEVPVSASTVSGEHLDTLNTSGQDIRVLAARVPSLYVESSTGRSYPRFYLRGYGNVAFTMFASQPVSLVYDDIVQESPLLKGFPMFDLEAVEVLRGPQGTLFGRNTPAGVVKFNSVKPSTEAEEGYFSLSTGTHNTTNVEGAVNTPLGEEWALRASILTQHRDDFVDNTYTGENNAYEGYDDRAARLQLLYAPTDRDFTALLNVHGRDLEGTARLFRGNTIRPGSNASLVHGFDYDKVDSDGGNEQSLRTNGASARLSWGFDNYTFYSITGYEGVSKFFSRDDLDGGNPTNTPYAAEGADAILDLKQFSQEFRVESDYEGPLNWQAGTYLFHEDNKGAAYTYDTVNDGALASITDSQQKTKAWALFGALNYDVTERLKATAGIRYTQEKKEFSVDRLWNVAVTGPLSLDDTSDNVSWDASLSYALTPDLNLYTRIATGFRAPSFAAPSAAAPLTVTDPETILSYEAGFKSELFDRRARLNFNLYHYEVKDQQFIAVVGNTNSTTLLNADKTVGYGAEMDIEAYLTERLRVTLGGSYNHTEIQDKNLTVGKCRSCTMQDPIAANGKYSIDGNPLQYAPKVIGNLTLRYGIPLGNRDELYFYTDWTYRSEFNFFLYEAKEFTAKPLLEAGARVGYTWDDGKYEVAAFCRNCTNETQVVGALGFNNLTGSVNEPRLIGTQFKMNF